MPATILLVDDDAAARRMMRRVLVRFGYDVIEAADGAAAVATARERLPELLVLDIRMPGELSGLDAAAILREDATTAHIPIVIVSASTHLDAREMALEVGCDAFVEKPVDFDELQRVLATFVPTGS